MTTQPNTERVVVRVGELTASWDGQFSGDSPIVDEARFASAVGAVIQVGSSHIEADDKNVFGAVAALFAYDPGRTELMYSEQLVRDVLFGDVLDEEGFAELDPDDRSLRPHTKGA